MSSQMRPKDALFEQFARVGKALASPKRLELLDILAQGERSVESVARATNLKLTTASAHLQTLRQGGLVHSRKDGTRIYYRLASDGVAKLYADVQNVAEKHLADTEWAAKNFLGSDEIEPVDREDLLGRLKSGRVVVLDVRPSSEFEAAHIDGAISIPVDELEDRLADLPDLEIVAYCRGRYCVMSYVAVRLLRSRGRMARRLDGGMLEWHLQDLPIAAGT
jgi:DNA-binding transcriptional ArsR family regulator/rhodanese-related sulfurtransferase